MQGARLKTLVIDDSPTDQLTLSYLLNTRLGCSVETCGDGIDALDLLSTESFDVLFLDLMMPVMDGVEVLTELRAWAETASLPVVVISGNSDPKTVKTLLGLHVTDYVIKPFNAESLVRRLSPLLSKVKRAASATNSLMLPGEQLKIDRDKPLAVIADGDPNFRHFFTSCANQRFTVMEANNGAKAVSTALKYQPDYVFVGSRLAPLEGTHLAQKIKSLPLANKLKVVSIGGKNAASERVWDASIKRSFVESDFTQALDELLQTDAPPQAANEPAWNIATDLQSAVEQVFGMMMGVEVFVAEEAPPAQSGAKGVLGAIVMTSETEQEKLTLRLTCESQAGAAITKRMLQEEFDNDPELIKSSLGEILNIVCGRLVSGLSENGKQYVTGLPEVKLDGGDPPTSETPPDLLLGFTAGDDIKFVVSLQKTALGEN